MYEALSLPIAVFPATNFPRIIIGVDNGVMPIDQMEVTITRPIEEAVNSVPGLDDVRSTTSRGSAEVDLSFNWGVDMVQTLQHVNSALARIQSTLPSTAQIETHRLDFASFPILGYSLTSDKVSQTDLWEAATYDIKPRLNRLNGVATVLVQGGKEPEFQITPDPAKMLRAKVGVQDILDAVNHTNLIDSPGLLNRNHQLFLGLITAQVQNPDQIGDIVIKNVNDTPVRIKDIGTVEPSSAPVYTVVTANGKPAVLISINRQPDSNTVQVADEVHQEIESLRSSLPSGVDLNVFYDQSDIVRESIASVRDAIIIGLLLSGFIIWLFLQDWGTALMTGLVIPVALFVTFIAMKILGQSFNMMTLGGLGGSRRAGDRRRDCGRREHRAASRRRRKAVTSDQQRAERTHGPADRLHADAHRGVFAADFNHRSHRDIFPRPGDRHERVAADFSGSRFNVDHEFEHASDSQREGVRSAGNG